MHRPNKIERIYSLQHLLGYVKRFPEREVVFQPTDLQLSAYADAAFNVTADGGSYYGYVVNLGHAVISTKGGRVKTIVRSSTKSESGFGLILVP